MSLGRRILCNSSRLSNLTLFECRHGLKSSHRKSTQPPLVCLLTRIKLNNAVGATHTQVIYSAPRAFALHNHQLRCFYLVRPTDTSPAAVTNSSIRITCDGGSRLNIRPLFIFAVDVTPIQCFIFIFAAVTCQQIIRPFTRFPLNILGRTSCS
jgi:hypothetical protein